MTTSPIMIVTPIWRPTLNDTEAALLNVTDSVNDGTPRVFVAPRGMRIDWYKQHFSEWEFRFVDPRYLASIQAYNVWMTSPDFYRQFEDASRIVLCQTDAVLVRPVGELNVGMYDYLGSPWTPPVRVLRLGRRVTVASPTGGGPLQARLLGKRLWVGNGGLSIRATAVFGKVAQRLAERFPLHIRERIHEDVYFAALGPTEGLRIAPRATAEEVFCESAARMLDSPGALWGFHGLERWNPSLAHSIIQRFSPGGVF